MKALLKPILIASLLSVSACSSLIKESHIDEEAPLVKDTTPPEYQDFDLEKDTLYDLLVAEIAVQRQEFNITLLNYIQQAHMTRDADIIKRAINTAQFMKDTEAIQEMALLLLEVEPDNIATHQLLSYQYSIAREYDQAMHHIEQLIILGGEARIDGLAIGAATLPQEDKELIAQLYKDLYAKFPDNHEVGYSYALILRNLKEYDLSLQTLAPILERKPEFEAPSVLKANLLYDKGLLLEAIEFAGQKFEDFPNNHNLGRLYATMLIENKQLEKAEEVFFSLIQKYPQASRLKLSHAIVMLENRKIDESKKAFQNLIESNQHLNEAHYYLARIADSEGKADEAIDHYHQVAIGSNHYEMSLERSSFLMLHNDRKDELLARLAALRKQPDSNPLKLWLLEAKLLSSIDDKERMSASLNAALQAYPEDEQLLYARAMNREASDDLTGMEQDLRKLMELNPQNAIAMNALGYTLADRTDRTEEAYALIQKALSLKPNNPAVIDSMGWVLYKLNKKKEALVFLLKAFQQFQDGEIAAHLGEVLWSLNQTTEAREIWSNIYYKSPEHKVLVKTIKRLDPELLETLKSTPQPENIEAQEGNTTPANSEESQPEQNAN